MKNLVLSVLIPLLCVNVFAAGKKEAAPKKVESKFSFEYREVAQHLTEASAPFEKDGLLVFSAEAGPHFVGIVFDFENFQKIHPFQKKTLYDEEGKANRTWYFYILEELPQTDKILYRLIIDGLWTTDPLNEKQYYDVSTGINLSQVNLNREKKITTCVKTTSNGKYVHFVYRGKSGEKVRLAGTFTKWDSWIYQLKETSAGLYELDLPLPSGTHYYSYFIGSRSFADSTNHMHAVKDGSENVSKLVID